MTIFSKCEEVLASGRNAALATIIEASSGTPGKPGFKLILADDGELFGTVGGGALENRAIEEARAVLANHRSRVFRFDLAELGMECGGNVELAIEYLEAVSSFFLFGGGHIARALSPILQSMGFAVTVFDPRPDATAHFDGSSARIISEEYTDLKKHSDEILKARFCVIATHGHGHDHTVLKQLIELDDDFQYIGLIGSKRKIEVTLGRLRDAGLEIPEYLYCPIGVKIGALTAAEIAVSIAAEVVAVKNGSEVDHMRATKDR